MAEIRLDDIYSPINAEQEQYHASPARHKLLIGGFGGGKTYPTIIEIFRHCFANPKHEFGVFRNTWEELEENIQAEVVEFALEYGLAQPSGWMKSDNNLTLINGTTIRFRPLTQSRASLKGMHLCGFAIDDPDVDKYQDVISFLFSRLRNKRIKAVSFKTFFTSNWEGRNWIWKVFMKEKKQGECNMAPVDPANPEKGEIDPFAYWICPTDKNPTLPQSYIPDMAAIHSEAWMNRYVYMRDIEKYSGVIYPDFSVPVHSKDLSFCNQRDSSLRKIMVIDNGFGVTAIMKMCTDFKTIMVYGEKILPGTVTSKVGRYLTDEMEKDTYWKIIVDPASGKKEQGTGNSFRNELWNDFGITCHSATNDVPYGIHLVQDLMMPAAGNPLFFMDTAACPTATPQMQTYKWKEPRDADLDDMEYAEAPVKKRDHCPDCIRYGCVELKPFLQSVEEKERNIQNTRKRLWEEKLAKLPMYRDHPDMAAAVRRRLEGDNFNYETTQNRRKKYIDRMRKPAYTTR